MRLRYSEEPTNTGEPLLQQEAPLGEAAALCIITVLLVLFGLIMLYSTSFGIARSAYGLAGSSLFVKQLQWASVGVAAFSFVIVAGYRKLCSYSTLFMIIIALLLCLALCFSPVKGARRWIPIPGVGNIQPSEFAKIVLSLFLASFCSNKLKMLENKPWKFLLLSAIFSGMIIFLVFAGRDMGTSVLLGVIFFAVLYAAGIRLICLIPWVLVLPPMLFFGIKYFSPFRWARLLAYTNPEAVAEKTGYQLWFSLLALGSGNWTGRGFMESRFKHKYLPEAHTDFILSIVGEELGFISLCCVILVYLVYIFLVIRISMKARTRQGALLAFAVATWIAIQAIINIGVISAAFPTKGMPAPFISYGGSSLVSCLAATALAVSVALDAAYPDYHISLREKIMVFLRRIFPFLKRKENCKKEI
ncbi:MAG: cell division protein FtsW [Lentisphaeria bacterium]|nr:cell division protein FtsW [Lentisphaeria bacterium]